MSAADDFWQRVNLRAAKMQPAQASAFVSAIRYLRLQLPERMVEAFIRNHDLEGLIREALSDETFAAAFAGFRTRMQLTVQESVAYFGKDIPNVPRGTIQGFFNVLSPKVTEALGKLDTEQMRTLTEDTRSVVRAAVQAGLEAGDGPRTIARGLRDKIGLAPNQLEAIQNYERALRGDPGAGNPLDRALRDRRFDGSIAKRYRRTRWRGSPLRRGPR